MFFKKISAYLTPYLCVVCHRNSDREQDLCSLCLKDFTLYPNTTKDNQALFIYKQPLTQLILNLKFNGALTNARILGELLASHLKSYYEFNPKPEMILPIPLHRKRVSERGFNQVIEMARPVAKALKLPLNIKDAERIKHTFAQATLKKPSRELNVKGAFALHPSLKNYHVLLLDDVMTTGATIREFVKTMHHLGNLNIDVWCLAKPLYDF